MDTGLSEARRCGRPCPYKGADFPDGSLGTRTQVCTRTQAHTASTYTCTQGVLTYAHTGSHICVHTQAHKHALGHRHPGMCRRVHTGSHAHAHAHTSSRVHMHMFTSTQACSHLHTKLTHRCAHAQTYTETHRHTHMHTQRSQKPLHTETPVSLPPSGKAGAPSATRPGRTAARSCGCLLAPARAGPGPVDTRSPPARASPAHVAEVLAAVIPAGPRTGRGRRGGDFWACPGRVSPALRSCRHHGGLEPVWGPEGRPEVDPHGDHPGHRDHVFHLYPRRGRAVGGTGAGEGHTRRPRGSRRAPAARVGAVITASLQRDLGGCRPDARK